MTRPEPAGLKPARPGPLAAVARLAARHPLWAAVAVGAALRLVAALSGFGWFGMDDYTYVIEPAWRWLADPSAPFNSHYRSELFPRAFSGLLRLSAWLGARDPQTLLRGAYLVLGLYSLAAIPGVYFTSRPLLGERAARAGAWLMATYFLIPRIATRPLIEVAAMPPLVWSLALLTLAREGTGPSRRLALGAGAGALLALAAMLRFQVGVLALAAAGLLLYDLARAAGPARRGVALALGGLAAGGLAVALLQGLLDLGLKGRFLGSVLGYLEFNLEHSSRFGRSAWYTYLLHLLAYTLPPATLLLARPLWRALRRHGVVSVCLAVFVLAHTLVPHKEDRFLFPVLPLVILLLAAALDELRAGGRLARAGYVCFWVVNLGGLAVATLSDAQRNLTVPLSEIQRAGGAPTVVAVGVGRVPRYYLGSAPTLLRTKSPAELLERVRAGEWQPDYLLWRPAPDAALTAELAASGLACDAPRLYPGDLVDRALVALNPRHNKRRMPTALMACRAHPEPAPESTGADGDR